MFCSIYFQMSDDSSDDGTVQPTPPRATKRLNVVLFRRRKIVEQEEFPSSSDSCNDQKSLALIMQNKHSVAPERDSRGVKRKHRDQIYVSNSNSNDDESFIEPKRKTRKSVKEETTERTINPRKSVVPERKRE